MTSKAPKLQHVNPRNPIQRVNPDVLSKLIAAQDNVLERAFPNAKEFYARIFDDLKLALTAPSTLKDKPASEVSDRPFGTLKEDFLGILKDAGITGQTAQIHAINLAQRTHLVRAFESQAAGCGTAEAKPAVPGWAPVLRFPSRAVSKNTAGRRFQTHKGISRRVAGTLSRRHGYAFGRWKLRVRTGAGR